MNRFYIGTNWKMHKNWQQAETYCKQLAIVVKALSDEVTVFIIPPYVYLDRIKQLLAGSKIEVGAQNMHWEKEGAYTGEISPMMLADLNVDLVGLGHSERRLYYQETDDALTKKVDSALTYQFKTLLCVGEKSLDYQRGAGQAVVEKQLRIALANVSLEQLPLLRIAYEPVWAIGENGVPAGSNYVSFIHDFIRQLLVELFGSDAKSVPLLYGGSVNQANFLELAVLKNVNGLFIGRSAWDINSFEIILNQISMTSSVSEGGENH